jgi:hypothetical protein
MTVSITLTELRTILFAERSKTALVNASLAGKATDNGSLRDLKTIFGFDGDESEEED